jgi:hypothetical protein
MRLRHVLREDGDGFPYYDTTYFYAGRWRTKDGVLAHREARKRRRPGKRSPIGQIRHDMARTHSKRERMIDATRSQREV